MLESRGIDLDEVQSAWGVRLASLRQPNLRLPAFLVRRFWEVVRVFCDDPAIGIAAARFAPGQLLGLGYLMLLLPSRLAALQTLEHYWPLVAGHLELRQYERDGLLYSALLPNHGLLPAAEEMDYWAFRQIQHMRSLPGAPGALVELRLHRPEPANPEPWLQGAGIPVRFGQPHNELVMDVQALRSERPEGNQAVQRALEKALEEYAQETAGGSVLELVADAVLSGLAHDITADAIAERLHLTPRTLQRTLSRDGWGFSAMVDLQRRYLAQDLLQDANMSLERVAEQLGYKEPGSFQRVFRRWYGMTPSAYREQHGISGHAVGSALPE